MALSVVNIVLPGCGLVLRDRLVVGTALLLVALLAAVTALSAGLIATPAFASDLRLIGGGLYVACALGAFGGWFYWERRPEVDERQLVDEYRSIATAYLRGEAEALPQARALCRRAPGLAGAWRLLEMVATAANHNALAQRAAKRAEHLEWMDSAA